jgi:hypothetical protein
MVSEEEERMGEAKGGKLAGLKRRSSRALGERKRPDELSRLKGRTPASTTKQQVVVNARIHNRGT